MEATTPHKRVTNNMASLLAGSSHRRLVILLDRTELMVFAGVDDLMVSLPGVIGRIVLGVVELHREDNGDYRMRVIVHDDEYVPMLRNIGSAVAAQDDVKRLRWHGRMVTPRAWGPYIGVRGRGIRARRRFQQMRELSGERMNKLVEVLWRVFMLSGSARGDEVVLGDSAR